MNNLPNPDRNAVYYALATDATRVEVSGYTAGASGFVLVGVAGRVLQLDLVAARRLCLSLLRAIDDAEPLGDENEGGDDV